MMAIITVFHFLLPILTVVKCLPTVVFPPEKSAEVTPTFTKSDHLKCLDLGDFMPALNKTSQKVECYPLATKGPCEGDNEWFTIPANEVEASCNVRTCPLGEVYYKTDCYKIGSTGKCGPGMELLPTPEGYGECDCFEGYLLWPETVTGGNSICYQEFTRGPCEDGKQIGTKDGQTVCQQSDCPANQIKWANGACYENLDCSEDYQIIFDDSSSNLTCGEFLDVRSLLTVPEDCGGSGSKNSNAECKGTKSASNGEQRGARLANNKNYKKLLALRLAS